MTAVYITIDTEYSAALAQSLGLGAQEENFARSIACETQGGAVGIHHQMDVMEANNVRGCFFVDPLPAIVWGTQAIRRIVEPIVSRGHDVQLHLHTEWLELAGESNPLGRSTGRNMHDFTLREQIALLELGRKMLVEAGAPVPIAFRAGNYGSNDDTLRALRHVGIAYDTSHVPGIDQSACQISLSHAVQRVTRYQGVLEVPVGTIRSIRGLRHAQVTALSAWEMGAAIRFAVQNEVPMLNLVSHSFELMSRDRERVNRVVTDRFAKLCHLINATSGARSETFSSRPPLEGDETGCARMPVSEVRTAARIAEQLIANQLYGSA